MTKEEWLSREGFNPDTGYTYVYGGGDSYSIKDKLKTEQFIFNKIMMWHNPSNENRYAGACFPVHYSEVLELYAWGEGYYLATAADYIKRKIKEHQPEPAGEHIQPDTDGKIRVSATCSNLSLVTDSMYGLTNLYTFVDDDGNIIQWYTTTEKIKVGEAGNLTATFKKHAISNGAKVTRVTRVKLEPVD